MNSDRPVFGLDIDGTLGEYHQHFLQFAEGWLGKEVDRDYDISIPLHKHLRVSKATHRQIKLSYRMGGLKRSMPVYPWAADLTRTLRSWGADVWLCTTRPYLSHDNIDSDTRTWVRRNGIVCQGVIWGEHKYRDLARTLGKERIVATVDDLPELCQQSESLGLNAVLAVRDHNLKTAQSVMGIFECAATGEDLLTSFKSHLEEWRNRQ